MLVFWGVDFRGLGRGFEFRMLHMRGALVFRASAASVFGMLTIACAVLLRFHRQTLVSLGQRPNRVHAVRFVSVATVADGAFVGKLYVTAISIDLQDHVCVDMCRS